MAESFITSIPHVYPTVRLRRNRRHEWLRDLVAETTLSHNDIIWPLFVREDPISPEIKFMPGVVRYSLSELVDHITPVYELGLKAIALFPVIKHEKRCKNVLEALNADSLIYQAVKIIKKYFPALGVITDPALDSYTDHGHDGLFINDDVANDESLAVMCQHALLQAQAGADILAPSDMMDGRVGAIRQTLDKNGFLDVSILSYAVKYASSFYGPFREALKSDQCLGKGHKQTYQMNPANAHEALREVALDLAEGADSILIKPGLPYLDIIRQVKDRFLVPTFAFHVSGEYAMLKAAVDAGMLSYEKTLMEIMICFKRAGVDGIITYNAIDVLKRLKQG